MPVTVEQRDDLNGFAVRPLCPFCSAPWTDEMIGIEGYASAGCPTCGDASAEGSVKINCSSCGRLIYQKGFEL